MLVIFLILMCTVSLTLCRTIDVTVHNQCPDIELISPVYFCNCGVYNEYSVETMDVGAIIKIGFSFDFDQDEHGGILMYEMQRKESIRSDHRFNTNITSAETAKDASKRIRLLVAWKIERFREPSMRIMLIEHEDELVMNEDKLAQLYDKINGQLTEHYTASKSKWLVCDNIILMMIYESVQEEGIGLKITISRGDKDEDTKLALWIDSER
jgi:hypothetical protein